MRKSLVVGVLVAYSCTALPVGWAWAAPPAPAQEALLFAASPGGPWTSRAGPWVRCQDPKGSLIDLSDRVCVKLAPGSQMHVDHHGLGCSLDHLQGRVFVRVASAPVALDVGNAHIVATQGEFVVAGAGQSLSDLRVLNGDAMVEPVLDVSDAPTLIAGTDIRARGRTKDTFKRDKAKGLSRTKVKPKPTAQTPPPPPVAAAPPPPPPGAAPYGPEAPEVPPTAPSLPLAAPLLGGLLPGLLGGGAGLLGLTTLLVRPGSGQGTTTVNPRNDTPQNLVPIPQIVFPASP